MVTSKYELQKALENKQKKIIVGGKLADEIKRIQQPKRNVKKAGKWLAALGILAVPFTGGASLGLSAVATSTAMASSLAATAIGTALTIGPVTISAGELMILCGGVLGGIALHKNYNVKLRSDGSIELTRN